MARQIMRQPRQAKTQLVNFHMVFVEAENIHKHYFNFSYASLSKNIVRPQAVQVQQNESVKIQSLMRFLIINTFGKELYSYHFYVMLYYDMQHNNNIQ